MTTDISVGRNAHIDKWIVDGNVAIIHSNGYNGSGWYTLHGLFPLLYDANVAKMINKPYNPDIVLDYCQRKYGQDHDFSGIPNLIITWLPLGCRFYFHIMDGVESIVTWDDAERVTIQA